MGLCSARIHSDDWCLADGCPDMRCGCLEIQSGFIFSQKSRVGCILGDVDQFFFKLFFEVSHLELTARLENLLGLLIAELALGEQMKNGFVAAAGFSRNVPPLPTLMVDMKDNFI